MKEITIVGCGTMGSTLIKAMMNAGLEVSIVDLNKDAAKPFIEKGARYAPCLDEAYLTDTILFNLPHHGIALKVLKSCSPDKLRGKMLIDTTTSTQNEVKEMQEAALSLGMKYLDCKLEVYPSSIGPDTGYIVYSGDKEVFDSNKKALDAIGKAVYLGEDVISAAVCDIAVLEVHFAVMGALCEAAAYGIKNGISIKMLMEQIQTILPIMIDGNFKAFGKQCENYTGKFNLAEECTLDIEATAHKTIITAMKDSGIKTPIGDAAQKLFRDGIEHGNNDKDVVACVNELL